MLCLAMVAAPGSARRCQRTAAQLTAWLPLLVQGKARCATWASQLSWRGGTLRRALTRSPSSTSLVSVISRWATSPCLRCAALCGMPDKRTVFRLFLLAGPAICAGYPRCLPPAGSFLALQVLRQTSEGVFVPLTVGGGIREFTDGTGKHYSALQVAAEYFRCGPRRPSSARQLHAACLHPRLANSSQAADASCACALAGLALTRCRSAATLCMLWRTT